MKRLIPGIILLALTVLGDEPAHRTVDLVFLLPNAFKGPIFVDTGRVMLPEVTQRQKNTYAVVIVDDGGEAVQVGAVDKVAGWTYRYTVVQRNGLPVAIGDDESRIAEDKIAFRVIGGYGPWSRAYRPGGFSAYFVGTKAEAEEFRAEVEKLTRVPAEGKVEPGGAANESKGNHSEINRTPQEAGSHR